MSQYGFKHRKTTWTRFWLLLSTATRRNQNGVPEAKWISVLSISVTACALINRLCFPYVWQYLNKPANCNSIYSSLKLAYKSPEGVPLKQLSSLSSIVPLHFFVKYIHTTWHNIFSEYIRLGLKRSRGLTDGLFLVHFSPIMQQTGVVQYVQIRRDPVLSTLPKGKKNPDFTHI